MIPVFQLAPAVAAPVPHFAHPVPQVRVIVPIAVSVTYISITTHPCHPPPPPPQSEVPPPPAHQFHHLLSINQLVLLIVLAHMNIAHQFDPAHPP